MPIYEYRCEECSEGFELFVRSLSLQDRTTCPKCGSRRVKRVVSLFGISGATGSGRTSGASCSPAST